MNKTWFWPTICAAVVVALPVFLLSSWIQATVGMVVIGLSLALVVSAFAFRRSSNEPGLKPWVPWVVALVGAVVIVLVYRQVNAALVGGAPLRTSEYTQQAKLDVAAQMKDPTSVMFTDVDEDGITVCGLVNAKNSFGAYSGAERFVWTTVAGPEIESALESTGFPQVDDMKRCMFDQEWKRCQGIATGDIGQCTESIIDNAP